MRDPFTTRFLHLDALSAMMRRRWAGRPGLRGRTRRMGGQNLYAHRPRAAYVASMAFLAGHHQVSLARHYAMLSVLPAQASLSSTVTFARGPREPCGERSWSR